MTDTAPTQTLVRTLAPIPATVRSNGCVIAIPKDTWGTVVSLDTWSYVIEFPVPDSDDIATATVLKHEVKPQRSPFKWSNSWTGRLIQCLRIFSLVALAAIYLVLVIVLCVGTWEEYTNGSKSLFQALTQIGLLIFLPLFVPVMFALPELAFRLLVAGHSKLFGKNPSS